MSVPVPSFVKAPAPEILRSRSRSFPLLLSSSHCRPRGQWDQQRFVAGQIAQRGATVERDRFRRGIVDPAGETQVAPAATVVPPAAVPSALLTAATSVPALTLVTPLYELLPERVNVPVPCLVRPPVPLITPE